jgi:hypothetical protein
MSKQVQHPKFGLGSVLVDNGNTQVVRFSHGIEEVPSSELDIRLSVLEAIETDAASSSLEALLRTRSHYLRK